MAATRPSTKHRVDDGSSREGLRQRNGRKRGEETEVKQGHDKHAVSGYPLRLRARYWIGFLMGLVACIGSIVTFDKDDSKKEIKFTAWLFLSLIGLYFHETRPFKKF